MKGIFFNCVCKNTSCSVLWVSWHYVGLFFSFFFFNSFSVMSSLYLRVTCVDQHWASWIFWTKFCVGVNLYKEVSGPCRCLEGKYVSLLTHSVVQEAIQFCVTAFEFSVAHSVCGVRKMLPLVWSSDVAVKDAVVQAYRRLYLNPQGDSTRCVCVIVCVLSFSQGVNDKPS